MGMWQNTDIGSTHAVVQEARPGEGAELVAKFAHSTVQDHSLEVDVPVVALAVLHMCGIRAVRPYARRAIVRPGVS